MRPRDEQLGVCVTNLQQGGNLALKRLGRGYVVTHLDIKLFAAFDGNEIYLLLV